MNFRNKHLAVFFPLTIIPLILSLFIFLSVTRAELIDNKMDVLEYTGRAMTKSISNDTGNLVRDNMFGLSYFRSRMYSRIVETTIQFEHDIVVILDDYGNIYSSDAYYETLLTDAGFFHDTVEKLSISGGVNTISLGYDRNSKEYLVYAEYTAVGGCYNVLLSPLEMVYLPLTRSLAVIGPIMLLYIVVVFLVILRVTKSFTRPVTILTEAAQQISGKNYSAVINFSSNISEFSILISTFNNMAENLLAEMLSRERFEKELKGSLEEKEILLKEIHHRVKNNMQIIASLLQLQSRGHVTPEFSSDYDVAISRINTMALVHEKLYQSKDFTSLDFGSYLEDLIPDLLVTNSSANVIKTLDIAPISVSINQIVPIGLIVNELVTNTLKHGLVENCINEIRIKVIIENENIIMYYEDGGDGPPVDLILPELESLGMQLISSLADQLNGSFSIVSRDGKNLQMIEFPLENGLKHFSSNIEFS